jgi:hypothetical protein
MSIWVIPYVDQDLDFWQELAGQLGPHIREVYFPMPGGIVGSGRSPQPRDRIGVFLRDAPLPKSVLVNPIILLRPVEEIGPQIVEMLRHLHGEFGVQSVVVSNLALARLIRETLPHYKITASVLMGIATPAQALMVRDAVDVIVPDNRLVRDLPGLKRLRESFSGEIRPIVNEACIPGCLHRQQHFYEMGYGDWYPESLCQPMLEEQPWMRLTGAWILPRHLYYYAGLYDSLKLAGRVTLQDRARYFQVLGAYIRREHILPRDIGGGPASVLEEIDIPDDLFKYILHCGKNCHVCPVCKNYYDQAVAEREGG